MTSDLSDPALWSLSHAATMIAGRKISSIELTQHCLDRIMGVGKVLNAFIAVDADQALNQAALADEALSQRGPNSGIHGVPLAHKDMFYRKDRTSSGSSKIRRDFAPAYTSTLLKRLDTAGAIEIGRLMMQEFCLGPSGKDLHYGQCRNPWSYDHVPGGSSGGSGSAVAGRLAFGSLGSDTNGSIRIPASANGIVGLKPTKGRVSRHGAMPLSMSMDSMGPLARSARDIARIMNVIAGEDPNDPTSSKMPTIDYEKDLADPLQGRKVGLLLESVASDLDKEVYTQIELAAAIFKKLGCEISQIAFADRGSCDDLGNVLVKSEAAANHHRWLISRPSDYARQARGRLEAGLMLPATAYWQALSLRKYLLRQFMQDVMADFDVLIMPVIPTVLPTIDDFEGGDVEQALRMTISVTKFNRPIGYLGLPSLCVPAGTARGLPTSFQIVGRPFAEAVVLNFGHLFLAETQFNERVPELVDLASRATSTSESAPQGLPA